MRNWHPKQPGVYYGYYFLELADYLEERERDEDMMNLLYVTIKAILNPHIEDRLVRCIYELRTMVIQGPVCGLQQDGHGQETDLSGCPVCHALHSRVPPGKAVYVYSTG